MTQKKYPKIIITQVRSTIQRPENQKRTIRALGLQRMNHSVVQNATPQILGMTNTVRHLVRVEEVK
jgi:large subunit ribosomal protein L30